MYSDFASYIGASAIATLLTFFGCYYVFCMAAARGERAGFFAGTGLALGLVVFGAFPIADIAQRLVQMTQYYQYVRVVVVVLALLAALTFLLNFRGQSVDQNPGGWMLFWAFFLGFLIHLITPLPFDFYDKLLTHGGWPAAEANLAEQIAGLRSQFNNPLRGFTLPLVAFVIYGLFAMIGDWVHRVAEESEFLRIFMMICSAGLFLAVAIWVGYKGMVYSPTLFDKATNFGLQFLGQ